MSDRDAMRAALKDIELALRAGGWVNCLSCCHKVHDGLSTALAAPDPQTVVDAAIAVREARDMTRYDVDKWESNLAVKTEALCEAVEPFRSKT